jgi:hypothetical protein
MSVRVSFSSGQERLSSRVAHQGTVGMAAQVGALRRHGRDGRSHDGTACRSRGALAFRLRRRAAVLTLGPTLRSQFECLSNLVTCAIATSRQEIQNQDRGPQKQSRHNPPAANEAPAATVVAKFKVDEVIAIVAIERVMAFAMSRRAFADRPG